MGSCQQRHKTLKVHTENVYFFIDGNRLSLAEKKQNNTGQRIQKYIFFIDGHILSLTQKAKQYRTPDLLTRRACSIFLRKR